MQRATPEPTDAKQDQIPKENKILAFRALKHGLKFSYENWRMWQNYMIVCMDVGEFAEACRALGRVVEELSEKNGADAVDLDVLEYLVHAVVQPESLSPILDADTTSNTNGNNGTVQQVQSPNSGRGLYPRVADLFTRIILPRISSSPRIFRSHAKLLVWKKGSNWAQKALDAHINAYNCSVVDDERVETDLERWRIAVGEVGDLVQTLRTLAPDIEKPYLQPGSPNTGGSGGGEREDRRKDFNWQFQARSVLRSFIARTKRTFGDEPEWEKLPELLESLKSSL